jgi:hypothetical protein
VSSIEGAMWHIDLEPIGEPYMGNMYDTRVRWQ